MTTKKELAALKKEFKAMDRKLEKLLKEIEKSGTKAPKASKAKTVKAAAKKAPAKKKATKVTDTDKVLNIINRSKKGVDARTLMKKTGFDQKKIRNMLFRASKEGKIQRADRGIYIGVK
jgi:predicted Rossmann fold nucleotide-binding protein DprA/Smf involved in DNA uptake